MYKMSKKSLAGRVVVSPLFLLVLVVGGRNSQGLKTGVIQ